MKWLELLGGLGIVAVLAAGVYFLVTRLKWDGDEQPKNPSPEEKPRD